ncbi:serine/threonine-protein kinase [Luteimonas granuli]|uniref:Serine/threonine protein kinase n=1 Tax=Luteimonas granuli TaxID=1176533 RepID=A0A518N6B9_9GAMM|nr:serine/threonine-protein kinase [Luteimonas granuli]QDW67466.1 serine/threonine protein kinase [Luteimonas granuli]
MITPVDDGEDAQATIGLAAGATTAGDAAVMAGARIGPYRLLSLLGRGGMGEVHVARQDEPVRRTVALKLLRARHLDTRRLVHFEIERQLLAQMRHPAIAQIFDAGTTADGRPYSAMELIDGLPVTAYCAGERLPLRERLKLFMRICEGVQHAHQKGVVHRDLKPGNILVAKIDGRALPKIIDFGIASITSGGSSDGGSGDALGTPVYMSPEQAASADDIDTRSDIYSLGVLLHELLCGHRPAAGGAHAFRPSARLAELPRAGQARIADAMGMGVADLRRVLERDLDWVVARATAPDRAQRYGSAMELVDDIGRFLDGRPLGAVPDSRRYRWGKFVRRNRGGLAVAAVVLLALLGGLAVSLYGLGQARSQQALAEERARQLETVSRFQRAMLGEIDIESMGLRLATSLRAQVERAAPGEKDALERVLAQVGTVDVARELVGGSILGRAEDAIGQDFADQPLLAADLRESVAEVRKSLGLYTSAAAGFGEVADLRARLLGPRAEPTLRARREQISQLLNGGRDQLREARAVIEGAGQEFAALAEDDPLRIGFEMHRVVSSTADDQHARRDGLHALLQQARRLLGERHPVALEIANYYAIALSRVGERTEAKALFEQLLPVHVEEFGELHPLTYSVRRNVAVARVQAGDFDGAVAMQGELVAGDVQQRGLEHPSTLASRGTLAAMLTDAGRAGEAVALALAVLDGNVRVLGPDHPQTLRSRVNAATIMARLQRYDEALAMQDEVIEARTRVFGPIHPDTLFMRINLPATLHQAGRTDEALASMATVLPTVRETLGDAHPTTQMAMDIRAMIARESGDLALEIRTLRELLAWRLAAPGQGDLKTAETAWLLAGALREAGQAAAEADALWETHVQPLLDAPVESLSPGHRRLADAIRREQAA